MSAPASTAPMMHELQRDQQCITAMISPDAETAAPRRPACETRIPARRGRIRPSNGLSCPIRLRLLVWILGRDERQGVPVHCTFGHTADQTARLWLTGRDTCTTSWCAPRTMHASDRLPKGCALLAARLAAPHCENASQRLASMPIVDKYDPQTRRREARWIRRVLGVLWKPC